MKFYSIFIFFLSLFISSDARLSGKLLHPTSVFKNGERVKLYMDSIQGQGTKGSAFRTHHSINIAAAAMKKPTSKKQSREESNDQGLNFVTVKKHHHQHDDKNLGFYSDYSRPRTRPPAHN